MMAVALPEPWAGWAARRRYIPLGVFALKRIVGVAGDKVCAVGPAIFLNDKMVAHRAQRDAVGRLLPHWTGCVRVPSGGWFLLNAPAQSFDSRYFGLVNTAALRGAATAL
jgi:type IV secretory pathway protease TraF